MYISNMKEKDIEVKGEEIVTVPQKKKQTVSISYTITSFGENVKKLIGTPYLSNEDAVTLGEIQRKVAQAYVKEKFNL